MCLRFTSFKRVSDRFQDTVKTQHCHVSNCKEYSSIHIQAYKRRRRRRRCWSSMNECSTKNDIIPGILSIVCNLSPFVLSISSNIKISLINGKLYKVWLINLIKNKQFKLSLTKRTHLKIGSCSQFSFPLSPTVLVLPSSSLKRELYFSKCVVLIVNLILYILSVIIYIFSIRYIAIT